MKYTTIISVIVLFLFCFTAHLSAEGRDKLTCIKLGPAAMGGGGSYNVGPMISIGERFEKSDSAIDVSINWGRHTSRGGYYSIPRILYLRYLNPESESSLYVGGGASLGGISGKHHQRFDGMFGDFAIGYEFERDSSVRTMLQLDLMQPVLPFSKKGNFPPPVVALSFGVGF